LPAELLKLVAAAGRSVPWVQASDATALHSHIGTADGSAHTEVTGAAGERGSFVVMSGHPPDSVSHSLWPSQAAAAVAEESDWGVTPATFDWTSSSSSSSSSTQDQAPLLGAADKLLTERASPQPAALAPAPAPIMTSSDTSSSGVRFAKHLATLSNGCAPPCTRLESLGWLLFESKRQQAALGLALPPAAAPGSSSDSVPALQAQQWLATAESRRLLEQVRHCFSAPFTSSAVFTAAYATRQCCTASCTMKLSVL
jgi:hypothetical protein